MYDPNKLRKVLTVQGRKLDWLADRMGYDRAHVSRVLNGGTPMVEKFAVSAADVLGVPVEWLRAESEVAA